MGDLKYSLYWKLLTNLLTRSESFKRNSVEFDALQRTQKIIPKRLLNKGIKKPRLKFNLELELIGLRTAGPRRIEFSLLSNSAR